MRWAVVVVLVVTLGALAVHAGDGSKSLEERVTELETRMAAVERRAAAPTAADAPKPPARVDLLESPAGRGVPAGSSPDAGARMFEWQRAYAEAGQTQKVVDMQAEAVAKMTPGTPQTRFMSDSLAANREELAAQIAACERARRAYYAAIGK